MDCRDEHPMKALSPIDVTVVDGMVTDMSDVYPLNAEPPIDDTVVGIMIDFALDRSSSLLPIYVLLSKCIPMLSITFGECC